MKKTILALLLVCTMLLSGCASMLERDYLSVEPYDPESAGDNPSALRVESYRDLMDAILYLVSIGEEHGVLSLYNYTSQDVDADLARACREVVQEEPLGAYAVDYIRHDCSFIVSYYEANIYISYRRSPEQIDAVVSVTGANAIRQELSKTMASFSTEAALQISYFVEDEAYIQELVKQAYYDSPSTALGMPEVSVSLYPDAGYQRIVEINLTYPENLSTLRRRSQDMKELAQSQMPQVPTAENLYAVLDGVAIHERTGRSTAYDALTAGVVNSEGAALAYKLLCDQAGIECHIVQGELNGRSHFWNIVLTNRQTFQHVDLTAKLFSLSDSQLSTKGSYKWNSMDYPSCPTITLPEINEEI